MLYVLRNLHRRRPKEERVVPKWLVVASLAFVLSFDEFLLFVCVIAVTPNGECRINAGNAMKTCGSEKMMNGFIATYAKYRESVVPN